MFKKDTQTRCWKLSVPGGKCFALRKREPGDAGVYDPESKTSSGRLELHLPENGVIPLCQRFFFSNLGYPKPSNGCSIKNIPTQPISEGFSDLGVLHDLRCWLKKPSEISPPATCRIPLIPRSAPCVEAPHVVPTALRKPLAPKGSIFHHKKALPVPIVCSGDFSTSQL